MIEFISQRKNQLLQRHGQLTALLHRLQDQLDESKNEVLKVCGALDELEVIQNECNKKSD